VAGQIDEIDLTLFGRQERETRHDRDAAGLLLLQPVGLDPGEGADQSRLAVIHMPDDAHK
jgi:hypothetical protein